MLRLLVADLPGEPLLTGPAAALNRLPGAQVPQKVR